MKRKWASMFSPRMGGAIMRCPISARIWAAVFAGLPNASDSLVLVIMGYLINMDSSSAVRPRDPWMNLQQKLKMVIYTFSCQRSKELHNHLHNRCHFLDETSSK